MTWGNGSRPASEGWATMCGSGGSSDCLAMRPVPNPAYPGTNAETGQPEPQHLIELGSSRGNGGTFTLHPHEVDQFVQGYKAGNVDPDVVDAVRDDLAVHPELTPSDPYYGPVTMPGLGLDTTGVDRTRPVS